MTILIHGWSRVVAAILLEAAAQQKRFDVVVLEGRPDACGAKSAAFYAAEGVPTRLVLDNAMGYMLAEEVDMVLVGAEAVVENGGIVNQMGTLGLSMCAKACGKPFYVAAESYKFARLFPLSQKDFPGQDSVAATTTSFVDTTNNNTAPVELPSSVEVENPPSDYTPAEYITLLFTDLGVLTPSAVSDELIRLYQ
uniref:Uncharacterized protein n=1 Tax=Grammatophora oceanica TaxID=210454 RepID=A0A7S1VK85_9STRA|mmetsp:Transcript_48668/g.72677  ORF Transcript_48668/g.72677 Transcript_48668/m.72677 type:complete len:195 (+) Transcript_48668:528-1112(+)